MRLPATAHSLRRLLVHAGLAVALLLAQLGMLGHAYTAHPLNAEAAPAVAAPTAPAGKLQHGTDARDICSLCLAYSVFAGSLPAAYHLDALALPVAVFTQPHAHGAPHYPFVSYASRAPPFPKA